jgi:hypothetical protein
MQKRRNFRVEDANETLPLVRQIATDIVRTRQSLDETVREYERIRALPDRSSRAVAALIQLKLRMSRHSDEVDTLVAELREIGCEVQDPVTGTVDFPAEIDGRPVLLCWQVDEELVEFWHEADEGRECRRSLPMPIPGLQQPVA